MRLARSEPQKFISKLVDRVAEYGTTQDVDQFLEEYGTTLCYDETVSILLMRQTCFIGRDDMFDHLISVGIQPDEACLGNAVEFGSRYIVDKLLASGCKMPYYILRQPVLRGDVEMVTKLASHGALINYDSWFDSLLKICVKNGDLSMVETLISLEATVDFSMLLAAKNPGNEEMTSLMRKYCQ